MKSLCCLTPLLLATSLVAAQEPAVLTLENVPSATRIVADEPLREDFSAEQAARYLDTASLDWVKSRKCATCHTNMAYLMARPALGSALKDSGEVREFFENYYRQRWQEGKQTPKPAYDPVVVGTALAFNDAQTTGELSATTRNTLDMMWKTQREDGGWNWAKCGWAPMEIDDHYGVTLAALAVGIAPGDYADSEPARAGLEKVRAYLKNNPAPSLHHRVMIAWASLRVDGLMEQSQRQEILQEVLAGQLADGGWSTPAFLVDWETFQRKDGKPHDPTTADAYGTGLAIVLAREMGVPAGDERLQKGVAWLKRNQRQSGKWFTRSPSKDSRHYFTNIGCAFAVLALQSCRELPGWPFEQVAARPSPEDGRELPPGAAEFGTASYAVVVKKTTAEDGSWSKVVAALQDKHDASVIKYETSVDESLDALSRVFPRYTCFVTRPEDVGAEFVAQVHRLTRKLDRDPYADTFWGILTGCDADNALAIARHSEPLTVRKVASGTEFATEMVIAGQWYDELVKNKHVRKDPGSQAVELKGPDDTTKPLVDLLNEYQPDLMITSGHATQADWQIGFRFRSGQFRSAAGQMVGLDTRGGRFEIDSPNAKVYLPIGNCLMGDINGPDAMALAWMNDVGVKQMLGYTQPTWFGYMGWGVLDYFVEQPGRYTLTEAFFANHHALIHRLNSSDTPQRDLRGLEFDRDVVAFYGDPKWSASMAHLPKYYDQTLEIKGGVYTLTITPNRGARSFSPVNTNGSQRGWRPMVQFLPHRIGDIEITAGADLNPLVADDFILVPNPRECDPDRKYVIRFNATRLQPSSAGSGAQ